MSDREYILLLQVLELEVGDKITLSEGIKIAEQYKESIKDLHTPKNYTWNEPSVQ